MGEQFPLPTLVAVMIMVSIGNFSWASFKNLRVHNLALGVGVVVRLSALSFARKVAQVMRLQIELDAEKGCRTYFVQVQMFFASAGSFIAAFDSKSLFEKEKRTNHLI